MTIIEFADILDKSIVIRSRPNHSNKDAYFYADFSHCEISDGKGFLKSSFGNGSTPQEALNDYAVEIQGKKLVFDAYGKDRQEFVAPELFDPGELT